MTHHAMTSDERLAARYGNRQPWRARTIVLVVLAVVAAAVVAFPVFGLFNQPVTWRDKGFTIVDATETTATFVVTKPDDEAAYCRVEALNSRFTVVGLAEVFIAPPAPRTSEHTVTVNTTERAVTATVGSCELERKRR